MRDELDKLSKLLNQAMGADKPRIARRLRGLREKSRPDARAVASVREAIEASIALREKRAGLKPTLVYPSDLPVSGRKDEIASAIREHQAVVICGETGSGKSTQLPKICLELGLGVDGTIAHTQPRRIAARSIARRVAEETQLGYGRAVGAKVRFADETAPETLVKVMTDGILLAETQTDRMLRRYSAIIIDEAHERSLNIDFLLGYIKQLLPKRPDLKVIVTSATIDPERFSEHFDGCPIIEVSGRTYPVEVRYRPPSGTDDPDRDELASGLVEAVEELERTHPGDTLVFFSGEREIREAARALRQYESRGWEILPLYARLSVEEQQRVFAKGGRGRRIVLATNVAETSLTVPGIRSVIDTGVARISRYSHRNKVQRLEVEPISRASAEQRKGRCGRVGAGVCIRLYSEQSYNERPEFTEPEILRTSLAGVILQMKALRLGRIDRFPFVEKPDIRAIRDGYRTLLELGAVDEEEEITPLGERLARLPIDPKIGRMVIEAGEYGCVREVLIIAAALSVQDPRDRPMERQQQADEAHARFRNEESDFLTYIGLWDLAKTQQKKLNQRRMRAWCKENFLSYTRLREWQDVHRQLRDLAGELGLRAGSHEALPEAVHRAILPGLVAQVGRKGEGHEYEAPHGVRFHLFPGSALFESKPAWVMAGEIVRTTRLYARTIAPVQPEWIEKAAMHLVKRTHHEPFWESRRARVNAWERISLYGLEIIPKRKVHYGPLNPQTCREMFIQRALVDGDYKSSAPYVRHNRKLIKEIEKMEARLRRKDLLASPRALYDFFDRRVPHDVYTGEKFERWRRHAEKSEPRLLFMTREDVVNERPDARAVASFPERVEVAGATLPVGYRFEPGAKDDGVTVTIPVEAVTRFDASTADWLVPGLVPDKVVAMIRALPKTHRRLFGPAPAFAERFMASEPPTDKPLAAAINDFLVKDAGHRIDEGVWRKVELPEHLKLNFRVVGEDGSTVGAGRDLQAIRRELAGADALAPGAIATADYTRDGVTAWDFGELPESVEVRRSGGTLTAHPALVDRGGTVALRAIDDPEDAQVEHERGVIRLLTIVERAEIERAIRAMSDREAITLLGSTLSPWEKIASGLAFHLADSAYLCSAATPGGRRPAPRDPEAFERLIVEGRERLLATAEELGNLVLKVLERTQQARLELDRRFPPAFTPSTDDMWAQLDGLVDAGFPGSVPAASLRHMPRYVNGVLVRLKKLVGGGVERDRRAMEALSPLLKRHAELSDLCRGDSKHQRRADRLRWSLEELRVSLFAQELRTAESVSVKKLGAALDELAAEAGVSV